MRSWLSDFVHKLTHWEYWPFEVLYLPIFIYWIYLSVKARSLLYFTASNPSIFGGGILGESKKDIYKLIPEKFLPDMVLIDQSVSLIQLQKLFNDKKFVFPVICKPDIGERGTKVEKVKDLQGLFKYHEEQNTPYFIQEFVDFPVEAGVFYYRYPDKPTGEVSSLTLKKFLTVKGDGKSTVKILMHSDPRARFQLKRLEFKKSPVLDFIPKEGQVIEVEPIGNHCKGTMFLNGCHAIDEQLVEVINEIALSIPGFYYGRFDLRCKTLEDLKAGQNFKILELNGAGSEPTHIYHPNASLKEAYKVLFHHWKVLFQISCKNNRAGIPYMRLTDGIREFIRLKTAK